MSQSVSKERTHAEWQFLLLLCAPNLSVPLRVEYCSKARASAFKDMAHGVVFEQICGMSKPENPRPAHELREHLPSRVTSRGFPDLDFSALSAGSAIPDQELLTRIALAYDKLIEFQP